MVEKIGDTNEENNSDNSSGKEKKIIL